MRVRRAAARTATLCLVAGALALTLTVDARADAVESIPALVRVKAPGDCATEASFWRALLRRTDRMTRSPPDERAAVIEVTIARRGDVMRGELRIVRAGQASGLRRMTAASCSEVADGLSLVAALAFDPTAKLSDEVAEEPNKPSADTSMTTTSAATSPPAAPSAPPPVTAPIDVRPAEVEKLRSWVWAGAATGGGVAVGEPGATFSFGGFVEVARERVGSGRVGSGLAPSFRLGVLRVAAAADADPIRADLSWTLGRASVCPIRIALARGLTARPCAGVEAGALAASTRDLATARDRSRPWLAPGVATRLAYVPVPRLFIEMQVALAAPLVRDEIVVDPSLSVYRAPSLVPSAELAAGVRFP